MFFNFQSLVLGTSLFALFFLPTNFNQVSARGAADMRGVGGREMNNPGHGYGNRGMEGWHDQGTAYRHDGWENNTNRSWDQGQHYNGWQNNNVYWSGGYNPGVEYPGYNDGYDYPNYSNSNNFNTPYANPATPYPYSNGN